MKDALISDFDNGQEGIKKSSTELHSEARVDGSSSTCNEVCEVLQDWLKSRSHIKSRRTASLR